MKLSGFTYIEVILTIALMIFVGIMASPFYGDFLLGQEAATTATELREVLAQARFYSMMGKGDDTWGVALQGNELVLFRGATYETRDPAFDEEYVFSEAVRVTGLDEITFAEATGIPDNQPEIEVALRGNGADTHVHTLTVSALGAVNESY